MLYTIVWAVPGDDRKWIPVDEDLYGETEVKAKELAGPLLAKAEGTGLRPIEILRISQEKLDSMVQGTTPLETFNVDKETEFEMLQVNA